MPCDGEGFTGCDCALILCGVQCAQIFFFPDLGEESDSFPSKFDDLLVQ